MSINEIKPYNRIKISIEERKNHPTHKVVYLIIANNKYNYYFENDMQNLNSDYKKHKKEFSYPEVFVAWLKVPYPNANAEKTWKANEDYMDEHHANVMRWSEELNGWFI